MFPNGNTPSTLAGVLLVSDGTNDYSAITASAGVATFTGIGGLTSSTVTNATLAINQTTATRVQNARSRPHTTIDVDVGGGSTVMVSTIRARPSAETIWTLAQITRWPIPW